MYIFLHLFLLHIFYSPHFPHSSFSTLHIFHTPHFPHSAFSTLRNFDTPHFQYSSFAALFLFHLSYFSRLIPTLSQGERGVTLTPAFSNASCQLTSPTSYIKRKSAEYFLSHPDEIGEFCFDFVRELLSRKIRKIKTIDCKAYTT